MITFIINPSSGGGSSLKIWSKIEPYLIKKKVDYEVFVTRYRGEAADITAKICERHIDKNQDDIIVAVGGDGTINDMLAGIDTSKNIIYANIPTGTGNDLTRGLGVSSNPKACLKRILEKRNIRSIDYGVISFNKDEAIHKRFIVSAGIGFDANTTANYLKVKKDKFYARGIFRKLIYIIFGFKSLFEYKNRKAVTVVDDSKKQEFNNFVFSSIHIHPYEGGGIKFAPFASNIDGKLSICLVNKKSKFSLAKILLSAFLAKHLKYSGVYNYDCREFNINLEKDTPVHIDGEYCGEYKDIYASCVAGKIRFIC